MSTLLKWAFGAGKDNSVTPSNVFNQQQYTGDGFPTRNVITGTDLPSGGMVLNFISSLAGDRTNTYTTDFDLAFNTTGSNIIPSRITSFLPNGYQTQRNASGSTYLSYAFKKAPKFFTYLTYTGDGTSARVLNHDLGVAPGMCICKMINVTSDWHVSHIGARMRSSDNIAAGYILNTDGTGYFNASISELTETSVTLMGTSAVNRLGVNYVIYLFAHDPSPNGIIQCGYYTGTGEIKDVFLGWKPNLLLIKDADSGKSGRNWNFMSFLDPMSNLAVTTWLNNNSAPVNLTDIARTNTGFTLNSPSIQYNENSTRYIYMAIKE